MGLRARKDKIGMPAIYLLYSRRFVFFKSCSAPTIEFFFPIESYARLKIFDVKGCEVATLLDGMQAAGHRTIRWNASGLSSGIYHYRLEAGTFQSMKRALLLK